MKKNLYYRTMFQRTNAVKTFILNLFFAIASWPKLVLEVFLRRNMGERYFSFATCVIISIILTILPVVFFGARMLFNSYDAGSNWLAFLWSYLTWYAFIGVFMSFARKRQKEVDRNPSVFDFKRFSLSSGTIDPWFYSIRLFGKKADPRRIEILYEPGLCLLVGLGAALVGQMIGLVIIVCSIIYSLSYASAYMQSDHMIMDKIDEMIFNEEMFNTFVEGKDSSETRGVRVYGRKPVSEDLKRKVAESFMEDEKEEAFEAM